VKANVKIWPFALCLLLLPLTTFGATLVQENFDDSKFSSRGWYDTTAALSSISTTTHYQGIGSYECHFVTAGTNCIGGDPRRHKFTPTNSVYLSYWVLHSPNWQGSGLTKSYHPHVFYLMTNLDGDYAGMANSHLTAYVEENKGYPVLYLQDGMNIDTTQIGVDLTNITENRAVDGCNGTQPNIGQDSVSCYLLNGTQDNGILWRGPTAYFFDSMAKTQWHHVEAYYQLNSISNNIGQPDGIIRYWYDGQIVINQQNVIIRTGAHPTMQFNQLILSPYIGDGSPVDQFMWIDNLTVSTSPQVSTTLVPSPPTNLRLQ
jgi:hypothetical protein